MGSIKIGSTAVKKVFIASTPIKKVYVGSTLIWTAPSPVLTRIGTYTLGSSSRGITLLKDGNYAATDWSNACVRVFSSAGALKYSFGSSGTGDSQFTNPYGICQDKDGYIYVTDWRGQNASWYLRKLKYTSTALTYVSKLAMPSGSGHQISYNTTRDRLIVSCYGGGQVVQVPRDLSSYTSLASVSLQIGSTMTTDGKTLYYTGYYGTIKKSTFASASDTTASSTETIYSGGTSGSTQGIALSGDNTYLVYVDNINKRIQKRIIATGDEETVASNIFAFSIMNCGGDTFVFTGGASDSTFLYKLEL